MAFPVDWPSWSQGAKSPELALETLGRDRDQIIRHTIRTESEEFARRLGAAGAGGRGAHAAGLA